MKFNLRTRLLSTFALIGLIATVSAGVGLNNTAQIVERGRYMYDSNVVPIVKLSDAVALIGKHTSIAGMHIMTTDEARSAVLARQLDTVESELSKTLAQYRQSDMDAEERALNLRLDTSLKAYFDAAGETRKLSNANSDKEAAELMSSKMQPALAEASSRLAELMQMNRRQAELSRDEANALAQTNAWLLGTLLVFTLIGVAAAGGLITRSVLRQIGSEPDEAKALVGEIARGNLAVPIKPRKGDTDSLLAAMKTMCDQLREVVTRVRHSSDSIATGSELGIFSGMPEQRAKRRLI